MSYLIAYGIYLLAYILIIILGCTFFHSYKKEKYHFFKYFPYEMEIEETFPYFRILLALFIVSGIFFHADFFLLEPSIHVPNFLSYFFGILCILGDILIFPLFIYRPSSFLKGHIVITSFFLSLHLLMNLGGIFYIVRSDTLFIGGIILFSLVLLIELIFLFMKDLSTWTKLEEKNIDGKISYVRGNNVLAIREWFFLSMMFITDIGFIVFRIISELH